MRNANNAKGVTLIELLISVLVLSVLSTALFALVVHAMRGWSSGVAQNEATDAATVGLQKLSSEIRDGQSAVVDIEGKLSVTFPILLTDPSTGEETYDVSGSDPVPRIYYQSNGNLVRSVGGVESIVMRGISSATFVVPSPARYVEITLTGYSQCGSVACTQETKGRVALRNFKE